MFLLSNEIGLKSGGKWLLFQVRRRKQNLLFEEDFSILFPLSFFIPLGYSYDMDIQYFHEEEIPNPRLGWIMDRVWVLY